MPDPRVIAAFIVSGVSHEVLGATDTEGLWRLLVSIIIYVLAYIIIWPALKEN